MKSLFCMEGLRFIWRFTVTHIVTYAVFGILFMFVSNYFDYFSREPFFSQVMKSKGLVLW